MYGSDWFMPVEVSPRSDYLKAYREVFLTPQLRPYYKDFFCRNALRFLNMTDSRIESDRTLSAAAKANLRQLVDEATK